MTIPLNENQKIKLSSSLEVFNLMHQVLMHEENIDRNKEHFWILSLAYNNRLVSIELISPDGQIKTIAEPSEVFRFTIQKQVAKIIIVHNHPSGALTPSGEDLDTIDKLVQVGKLVNCPVIDHLIITVEGYTSFADTGLLANLQKSTKFTLDLSGVNIKRGEKSNAEATARKMLQKQKYDLEEVKDLTGLTIKQLEKLKKELTDQKKK